MGGGRAHGRRAAVGHADQVEGRGLLALLRALAAQAQLHSRALARALREDAQRGPLVGEEDAPGDEEAHPRAAVVLHLPPAHLLENRLRRLGSDVLQLRVSHATARVLHHHHENGPRRPAARGAAQACGEADLAPGVGEAQGVGQRRGDALGQPLCITHEHKRFVNLWREVGLGAAQALVPRARLDGQPRGAQELRGAEGSVDQREVPGLDSLEVQHVRDDRLHSRRAVDESPNHGVRLRDRGGGLGTRAVVQGGGDDADRHHGAAHAVHHLSNETAARVCRRSRLVRGQRRLRARLLKRLAAAIGRAHVNDDHAAHARAAHHGEDRHEHEVERKG
mmetsp:Transcript_5592/g.16614  ORF Transcript_5592/g.16614 Transcript_5592/m.16614 type:complete len:336 (+) Transcript_5592:550-1557(+)